MPVRRHSGPQASSPDDPAHEDEDRRVSRGSVEHERGAPQHRGQGHTLVRLNATRPLAVAQHSRRGIRGCSAGPGPEKS